MSDDGFSDSSDEPNMEIQIETLMGSSFDLRVSAMDTVQDIKRRIHRVEGIPVTHQNLIFQSKELQDSERLVDVGIKDRSKLRLVLSMRGGPISTRRISTACEHQLMLKELKELLDSTRDEIRDRLTPGSKISVLVFKEGDVINLLRVIENEDGSYLPYSEKPISPPSRASNRVESRTALFEKLVEDNKMMSNITSLRKKMEDSTARKRRAKNKDGNDAETSEGFTRFLGESCGVQIPDLSFKLLGNYKNEFLDHLDLKIFEQKEGKKDDDKEEGNQSESEEIALKDKHRSKQIRSPRARMSASSGKSLYSESKGAHSHTKHTYARMHKKNFREAKAAEAETIEKIASDEVLGSPILSPLCIKGGEEAIATEIDKAIAPTIVEEMTVAGANRLRVARLVIENSERPKSTTESIEVEDNPSDLWSLHDSQPRPRLKSATYKLGVLKRRQSLNYGIDESSPKVPQDLGDFNYSKGSGYEVCSSSNFYHMPPFMASPSAIPPQYAPKNQEICDFYYRNRPRSPLYGRKPSRDGSAVPSDRRTHLDDLNRYSRLPDIKPDKDGGAAALFGECPSVQRLKNDRLDAGGGDLLFAENGDPIDELCSYYNLGSAGDFLNEAKLLDLNETAGLDEKIELPPVIKKRARCNFCNRKLNITNIYNCRCGKIFCSQHRYSEVHHCNYDYKTDGRRFLEQQNPLVTADKINRF